MTDVINIRQAPKSWESNSKYVYIGRAGKGQDGYFGNPFRLTPYITREYVLKQYRIYFSRRIHTDAEFRYRIEQLRNKTLVCFCKPLSCHGDIIVEYLDGTSNLLRSK